MAKLSKATIQKLAALCLLAKWQDQGAFGELRIQKALFFADQNAGEPHFFTFKRYHLEQYSDEVADVINQLARVGKVGLELSGKALRIYSRATQQELNVASAVIRQSFPSWHCSMEQAFSDWGYLSNEEIIDKAHQDASYTETCHDEVLFESSLPQLIDIQGVSDDQAEDLELAMDSQFQDRLKQRLESALQLAGDPGDWRSMLDE